MATTNTATATTARTIKLNEIVAMKNGTSVRIVRIKAGDIYYQDAAIPQLEGVPGWMLGCNIASTARFSILVASKVKA